MEIEQIYRQLKKIVEPIHAHSDQLKAIANYIESEFEVKVKKQCKHPISHQTYWKGADFCIKCQSFI
jgi:uncharacterized membrane protein YgaE (UPF0421/DUF939 family)